MTKSNEKIKNRKEKTPKVSIGQKWVLSSTWAVWTLEQAMWVVTDIPTVIRKFRIGGVCYDLSHGNQLYILHLRIIYTL
jgi:hypothetical protein